MSRIALTLTSDVCKFGPRCLYPCHCRFNAPCNSTTGACETGCDDSQPPSPWSGPTVPWSGPGCQVGKWYLDATSEEQVKNLAV